MPIGRLSLFLRKSIVLTSPALRLTFQEKKAFSLHLAYSFFDGIIMGCLALNEFVLIKSLQGTDMQIGVLFQLSVVLMLFSVVFNHWIRRIRLKQRLIRYIALVSRLPLILLLLFPSTLEDVAAEPVYNLLFLGVFLLFYLANPIVLPVVNLILKTTYRHDLFGKLYSYATSVNKVVMLIVTFLFGLLLDVDPYAFRFVYPILALLGLIAFYLLSLIPYDAASGRSALRQTTGSIKESLGSAVKILKSNRPYRDFEVGFMFYGFAWMVTIAVITIFFEQVLQLNYSSVAFYKNSYNLLAIIMLPAFGKLIGTIDPRRFAIITFSSLLFYLLFLALSQYFPYSFDFLHIRIYLLLIPAYLSYSVFAATMSLLWFIGSSYFSRSQNAADYQSIHLTLTGVRGLFAPILGVVLYEMLGFTITFGIAIIMLGISVMLMIMSIRKRQHEPNLR